MLRVQIIGLLGSLVILVFVLDQVRRRKLAVEYSLVWLIASAAMIVVSVWRSSIEYIAWLMGIVYGPSAVFVVLGVVLLTVSIHFSLVISRLSQYNRVLVQRLALLEHEFTQMHYQEEEKAGSTRTGLTGEVG